MSLFWKNWSRLNLTADVKYHHLSHRAETQWEQSVNEGRESIQTTAVYNVDVKKETSILTSTRRDLQITKSRRVTETLCSHVEVYGPSCPAAAGRSWLIKSNQQPHPSAARSLEADKCSSSTLSVCVCVCVWACVWQRVRSVSCLQVSQSQTFNTQTIWDYAEWQPEVFKPPPGDKQKCKWKHLCCVWSVCGCVCVCVCVSTLYYRSETLAVLLYFSVFVVDPGRVVFRFLALIHFTTETGIWNAHNSFFWIGAELKKLTERSSSRRPEAHPPPKSPEPGPVVMATQPSPPQLVI